MKTPKTVQAIGIVLLLLLLTSNAAIARFTVVDFDPEQLDFGMVPVSQSTAATVNMTNLTDAILMFLTFETDTDNYTAYPPTWALQPGESMSIIITFNPSGAGEFPDVLRVHHFGYLGSGEVEFPLMGEGVLLPPANLTASVEENAVTLNWLPPGSSPDELRFGSGEPFSAVGTSSGTYEFAARFTPNDLLPYAGKQLESVGFFVYESVAGDFSLKVYTGPDAENTLVDLPVADIQANAWNDVALPFSILIDEVDYLWIGYEINQQELGFVAGVDGGPGVTGSGDLLRINGSLWTTLGDYGYSNNWNIRGVLSDAAEATATKTDASVLNIPGLAGFNVYRNDEKLNEEPVQELTYSDVVEPGETYLYAVTAVYDATESMPVSVVVTAPGFLNMPVGWDFNATAIAHNIHIPVEVLQIGFELLPGDLIGVFYNDNGVEKAAGVAQWNGSNTVLTAYGNDPGTSQKDGFDPDENMQWKVFSSSSQTTIALSAEYSDQMPHYNGTFRAMGLSMLETLTMTATGDANCDGVVNILDVITVVGHITGQNPQPFCFHNADMNHDGTIDVIDVITLVNTIMLPGKDLPYGNLNSEEAQMIMHDTGITLHSDGTLAGLQFELSIKNPEDFNMAIELPAHNLYYSIDQDVLRAIIMSPDNTPIPSGETTLLRFTNQPELQWLGALAGNLNAERVPVVMQSDVATQIDDPTDDIGFAAHPNPATDLLTVEFMNHDQQLVRVTLMSLHGQIIETRSFSESGIVQTQFNTGRLKAGMYMLRLDYGGQSIMERILVK